MQEAIAKADALIEAHQYIKQFKGRTIVVKIGGSIMDEPPTLQSLVRSVCFMQAVGMRPVLIHGGGKGITHAMNEAGIQAQFVQGRRYTDERTLAIAEHVLVNQINRSLVEQIRESGHRAMGLHSLGSVVVFGRRLFLEMPAETGVPAGAGQPNPGPRKVDLGMVGEVEGVNAELLQALLESGNVPVIAPIARDAAGSKLNINADSVAGHVAAALRAEKLVLVSDTHGIRIDPTDPQSLAPTLTRNQIEQLIRDGVISSGMLPKVEASLTALEAGVAKTHIIDGRIPNSLMLEIYTKQGIGTEIILT